MLGTVTRAGEEAGRQGSLLDLSGAILGEG